MESFGSLAAEMTEVQSQWLPALLHSEPIPHYGKAEAKQGMGPIANRLFYFAIPPNVFLENAAAIKACHA